MRIAYVLSSPRAASHKVAQMILPQLEAGTHGAEVAGIFFFDDNVWALRAGDPVGQRLARQAQQRGTLLMMCDLCSLERGLAEGRPRWCDDTGNGRTDPATCSPVGAVEGVQVGCFPDLYAALADDPPDHVITL